jgi:hypothetical protein
MVEEKIYIIYIMVNPWVEFVKQYAKENDISYSHALKEAGSAYRSRKKRGKSTLRGKGLGDLPDVLQKKIVDHMDNKSIGNFSNTGKEFNRNEDIQKDLKRRLKAEYDSLILEAEEIKRTRQFDRRMAVVADRLETMKNNSLLSIPERRKAEDLVDFFDTALHAQAVRDYNSRRNSAPRTNTPWYQRLLGRR